LVAEQARIDVGSIEALAWEREQTAATGIGNGVAIPHARLTDVHEPLVAVGISQGGVDFDAPDGQLAHVIFLVVTPRSQPAAQLELSADIAHTFRERRCLERVLRAANFTEFLAALKTGAKR
jgi:mannitol/fructose-specific phosphotransferase system IIA component (Ntr-type)